MRRALALPTRPFCSEEQCGLSQQHISDSALSQVAKRRTESPGVTFREHFRRQGTATTVAHGTHTSPLAGRFRWLSMLERPVSVRRFIIRFGVCSRSRYTLAHQGHECRHQCHRNGIRDARAVQTMPFDA